MKLNWDFLGGQGVQNKKSSVGGVWIFSGTAHYQIYFSTTIDGLKLVISYHKVIIIF